MSEITKNQLKHIRNLKQKKHRLEYGEFIVEGEKNVDEMIHSNFTVKEIYATQDWQTNLMDVTVTTVTNKELAQMSGLSSPNKVLAIVKIPESKFEKDKIQTGITLLLNEINDPGNLGTIIRTADWFGVKTIVCSPNSVDCFNPKVVQSTKGSIANVAIHYINLNEVLEEYPNPVFAADMVGVKLSKTFDSPNDCIIMMGSESHGIPETMISFITDRITIPKIGKAESLNVAIATSIILHQFNS